MAELKTRPNASDVLGFLNSVSDEKKKQDSYQLLNLMENITREKPVMWGGSIIGFGRYHYKYASGREGDWFLTGFSPRKQNLTLYIMSGFKRFEELLAKLGKHSTGKGCLYIKRLEDIDLKVLGELVQQSVLHLKSRDQR